MTKKKRILIILLLGSFSIGCAGAWFGVAAIAGAYWYLNPKLPTIDVLKEARMQQPLRVYSSDSKLLAEFGEKRRIPVAIDQVPLRVRQAFLAAEDDRFEEHPGVDYQGLIRAGINQVLKGDRSQGGSTITMQVARNFFLTPEKTYIRKLNEIFLALKIERELTKDKILELYLNKIYLGKRAYGVAAAAQVYYGKQLEELSMAQSAMIAGLPKAPSNFNPIANPGRALQRRNYVLGRMLELEYIDSDEFTIAVAEPITAGAHDVSVEVEASYMAEMVRAELVARYGEDAYVSGMRVHTTIDSRLQETANKAIRDGLLDYSERHGYRGPVKVTTLGEGIERIVLDPEQVDEEDPPAGTVIDDQTIVSDQPVEMVEPQNLTGTHHMPQVEVDQLIAVTGRFGQIRPGFVLEIFERESPEKQDQEKAKEHSTNEVAKIYFGAGEYGELTFDGVMWAKGYISVNAVGDAPRSMRDVLELGDLIWLRPLAAQDQQSPADESAGEPPVPEPMPVRWQLTQIPEVEGALVSLDPQTGAIISLVGGFDFYKSKFNRAVQARRQPGSGFKPFVYAAALENGLTAASIINDAPVVFDDPSLEGKWRPENYSGKFFGPTRLREGIVKSRNLVSIRLLISLGIGTARNYAKRFGFDDEALPRDLSLALGSGTLSPLRLVSGFSVFANGGYRIEPYFIDRIESDAGLVLWYADYELACLQCLVDSLDAANLRDNFIVEWPLLDNEPGIESTPDELMTLEPADEAPVVDEMSNENESLFDVDTLQNEMLANDNDGESIEQDLPAPKRVLRQAPRIMDARVNYIMNSILRDVVLRGTGRRAMTLGRNDIGGKTGTSNDEHDAWFNGFNHKFAASVWVGFDADQPLGAGEAGSRAALPLWIDYMREALKELPEKLPEQPEGLVTMRIDGKTGLLATAATEESIFEIFRVDNVPTEKSEPGMDMLFGGESEETGVSALPGDSVEEELF